MEHFEGGKKSHVNNVATVFVMTVHLRCYCRYNLSKSPETKSFQSPHIRYLRLDLMNETTIISSRQVL